MLFVVCAHHSQLYYQLLYITFAVVKFMQFIIKRFLYIAECGCMMPYLLVCCSLSSKHKRLS